MRNIARGIWIGIALASFAGGAVNAQETQDKGSATTVIEDVTLISSERKGPLEHATVVIRDGRIAEVGTKVAVGLGS